MIFVCLGLAGYVPLLHAVLASGFAAPDYPLTKFVGGGVYQGLGAVFYVNRIPERLWPRKFDYLVSLPESFRFCTKVFARAAPRVWALSFSVDCETQIAWAAEFV